MKYKDYKEKRQAEINALPIFFAFSNEQFDKAMSERGLSSDNKEDLEKIAKIPGGGFCLKNDLPKIKECFENDPLEKLMKGKIFAEEAFLYEMWNHEYAINWQGDWDVCSVFYHCDYAEDKTWYDYLKENKVEDKIIQAFANAKNRYMKKAQKYF